MPPSLSKLKFTPHRSFFCGVLSFLSPRFVRFKVLLASLTRANTLVLQVAVKVQYPGVESTFKSDFRMLSAVLRVGTRISRGFADAMHNLYQTVEVMMLFNSTRNFVLLQFVNYNPPPPRPPRRARVRACVRSSPRKKLKRLNWKSNRQRIS